MVHAACSSRRTAPSCLVHHTSQPLLLFMSMLPAAADGLHVQAHILEGACQPRQLGCCPAWFGWCAGPHPHSKPQSLAPSGLAHLLRGPHPPHTPSHTRRPQRCPAYFFLLQTLYLYAYSMVCFSICIRHSCPKVFDSHVSSTCGYLTVVLFSWD